MKKIIHYKVFKLDEDLEKFQNDNEIGIIQVQPFNHGITMDIDKHSSSGELSIDVFVVFTYDKPKEDER